MSRLPMPFGKDSLRSFRNLQDDVNKMFDRFWHAGLSTGPFDGQQWAPLLDVLEHSDRYVVRVEVPGLDANETELSYCDGTLTIKGHKQSDYSDQEAGQMVRRERSFGGFARQIDLPAVDAAGISASCHNGLLEIVAPKTEEARRTPIKIEVHE